MNTEEAWKTWWDAEGKHMERLPHHNAMDHTASVTRIAWLNGAFGAADEIERLRRRLLAEENAYDILRLECEKLTADLATCRRILPAHIERVMYEGEG